ncbi:hypothetical protein FFLO_02159 [Filobasidium floriforme]|uniref:Translocation protein sec66 n=1 Tax=Filobasidium floriforme TaxID=5210 RepID=A0A8K0JN34_9TREE|nr:Pre protein translocase subunit Sec66-domain-containing protein [Filobasidium floriforme]KAG7562379.1 hypothetical protein FFLO_02159 [Filobasidium floriforme]KAH8088448.1 Pre protein translocase subunit Sec66-domain-containing protein [Filobasidium floriforme]
MALPIYVPLLYVSILVGSLLLFSKWHRKSKEAAILTTEPWFPVHRPRDLYISLLSQQQTQPIDDRILMAALLLRASEDVRRIHRLRVSKQALAALIQSGGLNEDVQARFAAAEKEMEAEVVDVVSEANSYRQGWGQWVFASASEMVGRDKIKDVLSGIDKVRMEEERKFKILDPTFRSAIAPMPISNNGQPQIQTPAKPSTMTMQAAPSTSTPTVISTNTAAASPVQTSGSTGQSTPVKNSGTSTPATGTGTGEVTPDLKMVDEKSGDNANEVVSSLSTPVKGSSGSGKVS